MPASALETILKRDRFVVAACLVALCLLAWLFLIHLAIRMEAMDGVAARMMGMSVRDDLSVLLGTAMSPATAEVADAAVNFALVTLMWAVMMVGMMLPGAAPTILLFSALERRRAASGSGGRTAHFVVGYFAIWSVFSVAAAAAQTALAYSGFLSMQMAATSAFLAGGIFVAAGIYEFTPLKDRCLTHCQSPLEWIPRHMRSSGCTGAFRMGVEHGAYCVGCCWMLMLLLFVGGVMNLVWIVVIAVLVLVQKLIPGGPFINRLAGAALVLGGVAMMIRPLLSA